MHHQVSVSVDAQVVAAPLFSCSCRCRCCSNAGASILCEELLSLASDCELLIATAERFW